ncbi:MAG TPA: hypothetical protein VGK73_13600 [Polyangiaceae bacterium]
MKLCSASVGATGVVLVLFVACGSDGPSGHSASAGKSAGQAASGGSVAGGTDASGGSSESGSAGAAPRPGGAAGTRDERGGAAGESGCAGSAGELDDGTGGVRAAGGAAEPGASGEAGMESGGAGGEGNPDGRLFHVVVVRSSDIEPSAPGTIGIVTFSVDVPELRAAHIEFGLDQDYGMTAPVDLDEPELRTLLLGMKPSRTYHFRIIVEGPDRSHASDDYELFTGPATTAVAIGDFHVVDAGARRPGFLLASYWIGAGSAVPFILDADGEIVWWYAGPSPAGIARAQMSADGKSVWLAAAPNEGAPLQRITMDALESESYPDAIASHDITPVSGSTMAYIEYGEADCDSVYEIEPSGEQHEVFESQGVADDEEPALPCHGNALRYSAGEDLYTFSVWHDDIFAITREGSVAWRLTERLNRSQSDWGGAQHGHQLLSDTVLVFANTGVEPSGSEVVEFWLEGGALRRFTSRGHTANFGDVQRLPGGNTLVTYSNDSLIQEVDPDDNVVLEIRGSGSSRFGYVSWRESLYGSPPEIRN